MKSDPVILYNIWDAGSARAVAAAGAKALTTGSWSVASAQGYEDGEAIPLDFLARIAARIVASVGLPLTVDFEGGYALEPDDLVANATTILRAGAIGVKFEDRVVQGEGLHPVDVQARRIAALRSAADAFGVPLFIITRTHVFLIADRATHEAHSETLLERAVAYAAAGAAGYSLPGHVETALIERTCRDCTLPVNVMASNHAPPAATLARIGVARIGHRPRPFRQAMAALTERCREEVGATARGGTRGARRSRDAAVARSGTRSQRSTACAL